MFEVVSDCLLHLKFKLSLLNSCLIKRIKNISQHFKNSFTEFEVNKMAFNGEQKEKCCARAIAFGNITEAIRRFQFAHPGVEQPIKT